MTTIHADTHDWLLGPRWSVIQGPYNTGDDVIRFLKMSGTRKLLDKIAVWTGDGWDESRWRPTSPAVPVALLRSVERYLGEVATNG